MRALLVSFIAVCLIASPVTGAQMSTDQLHRLCTSPKGSHNEALCAAYLMGVVHGIQMGTAAVKRGRAMCIPPEIDVPQAIKMFNEAAEENPDFGNTLAATTWGAALLAAYECHSPN